jgi:uncharacterized membrane protein
MPLTRKDLAASIVAALALLVYVANAQSWWYLGGNRAAAVAMVVIGGVGCPLGARRQQRKEQALAIRLLGLLGLASLALAIAAIVTAEQWALTGLVTALIALWAGTTLRHARAQSGRLAAG